MHGCEVSRAIEFENDLDGMSNHARRIVSPADPFVTCQNTKRNIVFLTRQHYHWAVLKSAVKSPTLTSIIHCVSWERIILPEFGSLYNADCERTRSILVSPFYRPPPPPMEFEDSWASYFMSDQGARHQRARPPVLTESRNNQHKGKLTTPHQRPFRSSRNFDGFSTHSYPPLFPYFHCSTMTAGMVKILWLRGQKLAWCLSTRCGTR